MRKIITDGVETSTKKSQAHKLKTSLRLPYLGLNPITDSIMLPTKNIKEYAHSRVATAKGKHMECIGSL